MQAQAMRDFVDRFCDGNQSEAARVLDVSRSIISLICSGSRGISTDLAARMEVASGGAIRKQDVIWPSDPEVMRESRDAKVA